ncbi:hypothetical protein VAR608DRAFT_0117 [Variovorax sp. HW608]|uniref:hypothetical protein n=1 Tax=Variovorax sp. HW608 TaxID=1034889 RepID=UPI00081FCF76|nr:hypothetical protein [Variovorax sp. HW608]SCK07058.1 hypothetical protein VAR608DRAFT_0117 [Variovorax sp. HW608]
MNESPVGAAPLPQNERRELLQRICALVAAGMASGGATIAGCGGGSSSGGVAFVASSGGPVPSPAPSPPSSGSPPPPPPPTSPGLAAPALGAHGLGFNRLNTSAAALSVSGLATGASGSSLLVCIGRGNQAAAATPTDNAGNVFVQLDSTHTYTLYPSSGTALFACEKARGLASHTVAAAKPDPLDEVTLTVVEVTGGGRVRDLKWREVLSGQPLTSASVTTTGAALLVAWWWGDAGVDGDKTALPDSGFTVIDSVLAAGALVQCAVAVKQVAAAGTYNLTWTSTPQQGAQLWLAAVQAG